MPLPRVLLIDDEPHALRAMSSLLRANHAADAVACSDPREATALLAAQDIDVVLLDLVMPHVDGQRLLDELVARYPEVPVIVVTGNDDVRTAVACMKAGAVDFLTKPVGEAQLVAAVRGALARRELSEENDRLRRAQSDAEPSRPEAFSAMVTADPAMRALFRYLDLVAGTSHPVLLTGETGTGKELAARALHALSGRTGPFVAVNVAGFDDTMLADALFGHRRGAYTGAEAARPGLVERAAGGTLFLDEIGDLPIPSQVKLLRLLQEREYFPLGSDAPVSTDARFLVATSRSLAELQDETRFRQDLFYRLRVHHAHLPPLRARPDDVPLLAERFAEDAARALGRRAPRLSVEAAAALIAQPWRGNVRELKGVIEDAVARARGDVIAAADLALAQAAPPVGGIIAAGELPTLAEAQERLVDEALRRSSGNRALAARLLGISRQGLYKMLKRAER